MSSSESSCLACFGAAVGLAAAVACLAAVCFLADVAGCLSTTGLDDEATVDGEAAGFATVFFKTRGGISSSSDRSSRGGMSSSAASWRCGIGGEGLGEGDLEGAAAGADAAATFLATGALVAAAAGLIESLCTSDGKSSASSSDESNSSMMGPRVLRCGGMVALEEADELVVVAAFFVAGGTSFTDDFFAEGSALLEGAAAAGLAVGLAAVVASLGAERLMRGGGSSSESESFAVGGLGDLAGAAGALAGAGAAAAFAGTAAALGGAAAATLEGAVEDCEAGLATGAPLPSFRLMRGGRSSSSESSSCVVLDCMVPALGGPLAALGAEGAAEVEADKEGFNVPFFELDEVALEEDLPLEVDGPSTAAGFICASASESSITMGCRAEGDDLDLGFEGDACELDGTK